MRVTAPRRVFGQLRDLWRDWREVRKLEADQLKHKLTDIQAKRKQAEENLKMIDQKMTELNPQVPCLCVRVLFLSCGRSSLTVTTVCVNADRGRGAEASSRARRKDEDGVRCPG